MSKTKLREAKRMCGPYSLVCNPTEVANLDKQVKVASREERSRHREGVGTAAGVAAAVVCAGAVLRKKYKRRG